MERSTTTPDNGAALAMLSDDDLVERMKELAACERRASVALIRSLVEFDARRLYLREGCSSLFTYCTQVLHLSEGSAYNRIETARAARRYPKVLEFHHVAPYAEGGAATADNLQLRCRAHNQYEARLFFGDMFVRERQNARGGTHFIGHR